MTKAPRIDFQVVAVDNRAVIPHDLEQVDVRVPDLMSGEDVIILNIEMIGEIIVLALEVEIVIDRPVEVVNVEGTVTRINDVDSPDLDQCSATVMIGRSFKNL
jgi:hypothetical protein